MTPSRNLSVIADCVVDVLCRVERSWPVRRCHPWIKWYCWSAVATSPPPRSFTSLHFSLSIPVMFLLGPKIATPTHSRINTYVNKLTNPPSLILFALSWANELVWVQSTGLADFAKIHTNYKISGKVLSSSGVGLHVNEKYIKRVQISTIQASQRQKYTSKNEYYSTT